MTESHGSERYRNLAHHMPDDGMQVLMFTHKSTDVWEDLALIMWAAGLQAKQVWSVMARCSAWGNGGAKSRWCSRARLFSAPYFPRPKSLNAGRMILRFFYAA